MSQAQIAEVYRLGQSLWLDYLSRTVISSGELKRLIDTGDIAGVTSNPTIFDKAIAETGDYNSEITALLKTDPDMGVPAIYERLAVEDIRAAADLLLPVFERTVGGDGYVSLEVSPRLAYNTQGTLDEARRLSAVVGRPNVMIKVPATSEGLPAIAQLVREGVNVNVTLMFSREDMENVIEAYFSGLERRLADGADLGRAASVASFFVSRIDVAVDKRLPEGSPLRGKIGIANTRLAYRTFRDAVAGDRFGRLRAKGARVQRFLCASTGVKDPDYRDVTYVEELIGPDTVNTLPAATLDAFRDHGRARPSMTEDIEGAEAQLRALEEHGIDLAQVCRELTVEGVQKFADSFDHLTETLAKKRQEALAGRRP